MVVVLVTDYSTRLGGLPSMAGRRADRGAVGRCPRAGRRTNARGRVWYTDGWQGAVCYDCPRPAYYHLGVNPMDETTTPPGAVTIRPAAPADSAAIRRLVQALADFERLPPPDDAAQARLLADAFGPHPRFEI